MTARPTLTEEMIQATAEAFCKRHGWDCDEAADLTRIRDSMNMDGYELAKELEARCGWMPDAETVEVLDEFPSDLREALRQACIAWARDNNIQPPLPIGAVIAQGTITGVYEHDGACYLVAEGGDVESHRRLIIRFENAKAVGVQQ